MPENASYVFIHHYIEGASNSTFAMTCCIVLTVVIVFMLVVLMGIAIYVAVTSRRRSSGKASITEATSRSRENRSFKDLMDDASSCNAVSTQTSLRNPEVKPRVQGIPLSTFGKHSKVNDGAGDSSESSAGLYDVLFPDQHEGEIVYHPPAAKTVKFNGQAFPPSRKGSLVDSNPGPSGLNCETASGSLDWDYFQQSLAADRQDISSASEGELEVNPKRIRSICWV